MIMIYNINDNVSMAGITNAVIINQQRHITWWTIVTILYFESAFQMFSHNVMGIEVGLKIPKYSQNYYRFRNKIYNVTIPENSVEKTFASPAHYERLGISIAGKVDVKYRIVSGDRDKLFKAEARTVGNFAFLIIRTRTNNVVLNREKTDEYNLTIRAIINTQNASNQTLEDESLIHVKVLDRNDLTPLFYPKVYEKIVTEDISIHKSIIAVTAEDADLGLNGEIYYSFVNDSDYFAIHPTSGIISLIRPLKYTENSRFELNVFASDRASVIDHKDSQGSKARVIINVKQVNYYPPDILYRPLNSAIKNSVETLYGIVKVTDKDKGVHGEIKKLEIVDGDPDGHFSIKPSDLKGEYFIEIDRLLLGKVSRNGYNLTFRAEDKGVPPLSSYKIVSVNIFTRVGIVPIFKKQLYEVSVPETSPVNTPVIRLKVTEPDFRKYTLVFLEIVGGNEGGEFRINPDTGMLYTQKLLDAEYKSFYTLTVSAVDHANVGIRKQSSAKVKINIEDVNDNDPIFNNISTTYVINENLPIGTAIVKLTAKDSDSGENSYISYIIANLNEVPFEIDHFTGILRTTSVIDYETMQREYLLSVRASDWGLPYRRQTELELIIKIRNVNDNRPQFERINCVGMVLRNIPVGTEVFTLSSIDLDGGDFITYRLMSGNEDGCFNLDPTSGVLSVACDLSGAELPIRILNFSSTDGLHFSDEISIHINLIYIKENKKNGTRRLNVESGYGNFECRETGIARRQAEILAIAEKNTENSKRLQSVNLALTPRRYGENFHAPEFINFPRKLLLNESVPLGKTVIQIQGKDRDLGYNGKLTFAISDGDSDSVFRIDFDTGELEIIGFLDRERQDQYILKITVFDLGQPQKFKSDILPITILDVNDNPPIFVKALASFHLTENTINGSVVFQLRTTDADLGDNAKVTYTMITDTSDFFVDALTGILYVMARLDRETTSEYELHIIAKDNGKPSLSSEAIIRIFIEDINDNIPKFSATEFLFKVREDVPRGTLVAMVEATDVDLGDNAEIYYSLKEENVDESLFKIDKYTGIIRTQSLLDYEILQVHNLIIRAIDGGTPSLTSEIPLVIEVLDVNENRFAPEFSDFVFVGSVIENGPIDLFVMNVSATDADPYGMDSKISYSIRDGDGMGFLAVNNNGEIRTLRELDSEEKDHFWLTLCAQDQAMVPLSSCVQIFIAVSNINDNVPLTEKPVYYTSVLEGSPSGVFIFQLMAEDKDVDPNKEITYKIISGNPEGFFDLNAFTGLLSTTARKLDRENQSEHILEVSICDNGSPVLSSTTRVVIAVDDVNDHSPKFDQRFYKVQIPSTLAVNTSVFQMLALDSDIGENGRISYLVRSGKGKSKFGIDSKTGIVYVTKRLHPDTEYDLNIRAEDNGFPKRSSSAKLNIVVTTVSNHSLHYPVIESLDTYVDVTESDRPGFLVTLIQASDQDGDQLLYNIVAGDVRDDFYIGRDNGNILLSKPLDREVQQKYNLTISVTDGIYLVKTQLYVNVIDINDNRPQFSKDVYQIDISEGIEEESIIMQLHATDLDEDKKIFYTLHTARDPSSLSLFRVDSLTGNVLNIQRLELENVSEHILIVIAKDQGTPANRNYAKIIIKVHDHNDHYPEFLSKIIQSKIPESSEIGSKITQVFALDRDYGKNAEMKYSIVSGNVRNAFKIDPIMGQVTVAKSLDMNEMQEYMLQIKASDQGSPSLSSQIPLHIIISLAENDPPKFSSRYIIAEVFENVLIGSYVTRAEAHSSSSVFYDIFYSASDTFKINPSTGIIATKDIIDYEKKSSYNITIKATNMASISSSIYVIIHVLDVNDNAPFFVKNKYVGEVSEAAQIGSFVLNSVEGHSPLLISILDFDAGVNSMVEYNIIDDVAKEFFSIDHSTGAVKVINNLDYEETSQFVFQVFVSDLGSPKLFGRIPAEIVIEVKDTNDCPPAFKHRHRNVTLYLPTYDNIFVTEVNAVDADRSTKIRYDIIEGNVADTFTINSDSGVITTRNVERLESAYVLHLRASDGLFSSVTQVYISVETSENSGLVFRKSVYEFTVVENSTKIFTIGLVNVLGANLNEHIEYKILNPTSMFKIGMTSGVIETTGQMFDRELQDNYKLILEAKSLEIHEKINHMRRSHAIASIHIADINDNCPLFVNLPYYAIAFVDDLKGSVIKKVQAVDLDSLENGEVRYEMKKGNGELFKVDRKTGELTLRQTLEGYSRNYELIIAAYDSALTPCSTEVFVHVKVVDRSVPVFTKQFYFDVVTENIELYSTLSIAIQAESPLKRILIYTITSGNDDETFEIDFISGIITVVNKLDYESRTAYALVVRATDSISGISADVPVSIQIEDFNDCYPEIEKNTYNVTIAENAVLGSQVIKINAHDNDTLKNRELAFFIDQQNYYNSTDFFDMDTVEGIIYLRKSLDYEIRESFQFMVVVCDHGTPSLCSKANVWISVLDLNDNAPRFIEPSFTSKLSLQAARGQFVTVTTAYDLDKSDAYNLIFKIVNGNEMQTYAIERTSGIITVQNIESVSGSQLSLIKVSVTDGVYTSFARVKIILLPENINAPTFSELVYDVNIRENTVPGIHLLNVSAEDEDLGKFSKLTYDIFSADMREYFSIDKTNGVVETKIAFDREKCSDYEILVKATDDGGKYGFAMIKVRIEDVNDNAPLFVMKEYRTTVKTNVELNSVILKVRAIDLDEYQNKVIRYYLLDQTMDPMFKDVIKMNEINGEILINKPVTELANKLLQGFVRALDNGSPKLYSEVHFCIRFVNSDKDVPILEKTNLDLYVSESLSPGTVLTKIRFSGNFTPRFSIPMESSFFAVSDNGEFLLMQPLDREKRALHTVFVSAESLTVPTIAVETEFNIYVQDENDNSPIFKSSSYSITVTENVDKMSSVLKVSARDADSGSNGDIRYYFAEDAYGISNLFDLDLYSGWITTLTPLDKENRSKYHFHVIAADNGHFKHITKVPVEIRLKDYNDNPHCFKKQIYEISVEENALPGTVLLFLSLIDLDEEKTDIDYYIHDGDIYYQFQIGKTGELFISSGLDREEKAFYNLSLIATDGKFVAKTSVLVSIRDINDNIPYCLFLRYEVFINESLAVGSSIIKIAATDFDENGTEILRYYLTGAGSDDFIIDKQTGVLKTLKIINREFRPKYIILAHVQDGLNLQWECVSEIIINVIDLNDNKPEFSLKEYIVNIAEDAEIGTIVTKIHATDKDIGLNRKVLYSFTEKQIHFHISKENGIVTLAKELDRENIAKFNISVRSEDCGSPTFYSTTSLIINVLDINDNPPEFYIKHYSANISEGSPFKAEVIRVSAASKDSGVNAEISYFVIGGNEQEKFVVDVNTGSVLVNGTLDYEKTKGYFLTIQAVDGGTPPLSNVATLNISILDINDNHPNFLQNSYQVKVKEDIDINQPVLQVLAVDEDSGKNAIVTYRIEGGDRLNQFSVNEHSGYILTSSSLDRESITDYILEVEACDSGYPKLCGYIEIYVVVLDVNDNPPLFAKNNYSTVVQENRGLGYVLLKFDIYDEDDLPNTSPYTFDFRRGNEVGFFRLEQDGTLRTAGRFNHKVCDSYRLRIRVFDNGTPPLFSDTWVNVKVIEESQYPPVITPLEITVNSYEDGFVGGFLGRIFASDLDQYDTLYYDLSEIPGENYLPKSFFNISHENGNIFALNNFNVGVYRVNASVTDGKFQTSAILKINVEYINTAMLQNAVVVQFKNITPREFILSYRKVFIRSIRTIMRCRQKDVIIISVQASKNMRNKISSLRMSQSLKKTPISNIENDENNLDILFTVKKQQVNSLLEGYFSKDEIRSAVVNNAEEIKKATNLVVQEIISDICSMTECVNGKCKYKILLSKTFMTTYTDVISFVSPNFKCIHVCECKPGFDGKTCEEAANACYSDPCLPPKVCLPLNTSEAYRCVCPMGYVGQFCDRGYEKCQNSSCNILASVSFGGKSYAHYKINTFSAQNVVENQFVMSLRVRTLQQTSTLMYARGEIYYNILEISNGTVQYKFDLGSGEGYVSVTSVYVANGEWHNIRLERILNSAKLQVDYKHVSQGSAPGINGIPDLLSHDIFIGAEVKTHSSTIGFENIQRGFVGCLGDIQISLEPLPLYISGGSTIAALKGFKNIEFTCNPSTAVVRLGVCGAQPCLNGGLCIDLEKGNFKCQCRSRFTGKVCQFDLEPCSSSPCLFGGQCHSKELGNYSCSCPLHLSGKRCESGRFCIPNPCKNGGTCEEADGAPHCTCRGYKGITCDIDVNECENQPCGNGATCINESGSFRCICPSYLTGASCGDPLYSNSITIKLKNLSVEHVTGIISGATIMFVLFIACLCLVVCQKKASKTQRSVRKIRYDAQNLNSLKAKEYECNSKLSNLKMCQRPTSYTATINEHCFPSNAMFVNNLDILRSYGSAGDELENIPLEYQKVNCKNQQKNINTYTHFGNETSQKQTWSEQMYLRTFGENKPNNEKSYENGYIGNRLESVKTSCSSSARLIHVKMPNICPSQCSVEISTNSHEQYHWDCSDWARKSHNPLPDITEVPGAEIVDSSSFYSNDSKESQVRVPHLIHNMGAIRDITSLSEGKEASDYMDYEDESCGELFTPPLDITFSTSRLSISNETDNEDNATNIGATYLRHPNSYLPSFNIPSEIEEETMSIKNINDFKGNCNRKGEYGSSENIHLLYKKNYNGDTNSDGSLQLCEIDDSELDEFLLISNQKAQKFNARTEI